MPSLGAGLPLTSYLGELKEPMAKIFMRSPLKDLAQFQRQEAVAMEVLKAIVEGYGSRYSFSKLSRH